MAVVSQSSVARPGDSLGVVVGHMGKESRVGEDVQKSTPTSWTQTWFSLDSDARSHFSASSKMYDLGKKRHKRWHMLLFTNYVK